MPRFAHTPLMRALQTLVADHAAAEASGRPVAEVRTALANGMSRRAFLGGAAAVSAGIALAGLPTAGSAAQSQAPRGRGDERIAIVGAGIAGLTAALTLADGGVQATVYEASSRIGGRMYSNTTHWNDGQVSEWGGELIDTGHSTIRRLAKRFNLALDDLPASSPATSTTTYHFDGAYYPVEQVDRDFLDVYPALQRDLKAAGYPTTWDASTAEGRALDAMSVRQWIETRVPGGFASKFGQLLDVAYNIEFGAETADQSALNLVYMLGYSPRQFSIFGESDEVYHIRGGNQQLPLAIAAALPKPVRLGWRLTKMAQEAAEVVLTFDANGEREVVRCDRAILTLPFAVLRTLDISDAGFDARKRQAIREQGAGRNGKLQLQFTSRPWTQPGPWGVSNGESYSDVGYQVTWEVTRAQAGAGGILNNYTGGDVTGAIPVNTAYSDRTSNPSLGAIGSQFLQQASPVFPGIAPRWNGKTTLSLQHRDPNLRLAYSYYRVGQYQQFGGYEAVAQGRVHFAGEHTTQDFQGFMEGGAITGAAAADEVLRSR